MVVIRLRSGGLWLWSPTAPTPALFAEVDALGPVEHLVSPNRFHYAALPAWKARYPHATVWASPGVRERARSQQLEVPFDADLQDDAPAAWAQELEQLVFRGSRFVEEVVFFHKASSTLILADLVMALEQERVRPRFRWLLTLGGAMWPGQTPREVQATSWGRKSQARACYQRMLGWQPRRVLFAHGRCYLDDAVARLERAFAWLR
jgi:glyoxylase-like metal-dependent hydrolase (beta-lactamase superfamily II)